MKAGCYLTLAMLTGLILAYHEWLRFYVDPPAVWIASGVLGLFIWFCIGALWNAWILGGSIRALRNACDGISPTDGALSAVAGEIHPYGEPIIAPMTETPCVLYEYEISRRVSNGDEGMRNVVDFSGIGMAPCEVRTDQQTIALYGFPEMEEFPNAHAGPGSRERAREYVQATEWEDYSGIKLLGGFSAMLGALTSREEGIRRDFRMVGSGTCPWIKDPDDTPKERRRKRLREGYEPSVHEKRIEIGQKVLAIGVYDASAEALKTRTGTNLQRLRLLRGTAQEALRRAVSSRRSYLIGGLLGLVVIHAIALGVLTLYCRSNEVRTKWKEALKTAIEQSDLEQIDKQLDRGLEVSAPLDGEDRTGLHLAENVDVVRHLINRGADLNAADKYGLTPLMTAVRRDRIDVLKALIEAGAEVDHIRTEDQSTALTMADDNNHAEAAELLRAAGAKDEVVTAENGEPIDSSHEAFRVAVEYVAAIYASDGDRLRKCYCRLGDLDDPDWELWQNTRPREPQLDHGYVRNGNATLQMSGTTSAGFETTWVLQLRQQEGQWCIRRERWVTN